MHDSGWIWMILKADRLDYNTVAAPPYGLKNIYIYIYNNNLKFYIYLLLKNILGSLEFFYLNKFKF